MQTQILLSVMESIKLKKLIPPTGALTHLNPDPLLNPGPF